MEEISHMIDNDCKTGVSTDAVLKLGQSSKCTNVSCLCSLTSSRLVSVIVGTPRTEDPRVVDMNDSELSPELLEALISGAYTGKVEDFDIAIKVSLLEEKCQF